MATRAAQGSDPCGTGTSRSGPGPRRSSEVRRPRPVAMFRRGSVGSSRSGRVRARRAGVVLATPCSRSSGPRRRRVRPWCSALTPSQGPCPDRMHAASRVQVAAGVRQQPPGVQIIVLRKKSSACALPSPPGNRCYGAVGGGGEAKSGRAGHVDGRGVGGQVRMEMWTDLGFGTRAAVMSTSPGP
jgi:hypothetical protein